jgi:hypothetical protein
MFKRLLILLMLIPLLLVACSGVESNATITEAPATQSDSPQGETVQAAPTETAPAPATSTPTEKIADDGPQMECTLVSSQQEAPAELEAILGVKETDWVQGPETAAVTIVEYSDFQ